MRTLILLLACGIFFSCDLLADTTYIKVHFLYGSKPKREYKDTERRWFGGILGGHVGIEVDSNYIIDFVPSGSFHLIEHPKKPNSRFATNTVRSFWETFGSDSGDVKRTTIVIPINAAQKQTLDSIAKAYTSSTPYDYAFIGMRCAAAAYDVLAQTGVLKEHSRCGTYARVFYPKKLRKRLLKKAGENGWTVRKVEGCATRVWEGD